MRLYVSRILPALIASLTVLLAPDASAIVFDDGKVHVIDAANSFRFEGVQVYDGPPSRPTTTLEVISGGEIGTVSEDDVAAFGSSEVTISGGTLGRDLWLCEAADLRMSGGTIAQTIRVQDDATAIFSGGVIGELNTNGQSRVEVLGGEFTRFFKVNSESAVYVYGADVSCTEDPECNLRVSDRAFLLWSGHVEGDLVVANFGTAALGGGHVEGDLVTTNFGYAVLEGGTIAGSLFALDSSLIWIHGSDFNYPTDEILETSGTLTGTLDDGTPINIPFVRDPSADIWLPEPSALTALGSGIAMLALLYRRRRYSVKQ